MASHEAATGQLEALSVLTDRSRWRMFSFIRRARRGVTREEAAESIGISRKLAAFHLDKLVDAGLLHAHYDAPGEARRVGRRPKVYEPTDAQISVSIPGRRYDLIADLLLDAVLSATTQNAPEVAIRTARERGTTLGASDRERLGGDAPPESALACCERMLEEHGYEPGGDGFGGMRLRNCPFHALAARAPDLVCGMNHAFVAGYLEGLGLSEVHAALEPTPGECCVRLVRRVRP